jgi:hypothetical protein
MPTGNDRSCPILPACLPGLAPGFFVGPMVGDQFAAVSLAEAAGCLAWERCEKMRVAAKVQQSGGILASGWSGADE